MPMTVSAIITNEEEEYEECLVQVIEFLQTILWFIYSNILRGLFRISIPAYFTRENYEPM